MKNKRKRGSTYKLYTNLSRFINYIYPTILFLLFVVFFAFGGVLVNDSEFKEFGINFLAEMAGIFVTVYVVELFYNGMRNHRKLPIRIIIWRDLVTIFDRYYLLWKAAYNHTQINTVDSIEQAYNLKLYKEMMKKLNLDDRPTNQEKLNWAELISLTTKDIEQDITDFIRLHYSRLDPILLSSLFQFLESDFLGSTTELEKLKRLRNNGGNSFYDISLKPDQETFDLLTGLYYWIVKEKEKLHRSTNDATLNTTFSSEFDVVL